jgi:methionyl-tRNA formyltransferase
MNGDTKTGVTLMEMVSAMDAGRMYDKEEVDILEDDTYTSLSHKISLAAEKLILRDLVPCLEGKLPGVPQDESQVTFADKIKPEHEHLPLEVSAHSFVRYAHGLSEEPGGYLLLNNEKLKIYKARVANNDVTGKLGEIVEANKHLLIQLQDGQVEILDLQLQGKKRMDARSFLNGQRNLLGAILL